MELLCTELWLHCWTPYILWQKQNLKNQFWFKTVNTKWVSTGLCKFKLVYIFNLINKRNIAIKTKHNHLNQTYQPYKRIKSQHMHIGITNLNPETLKTKLLKREHIILTKHYNRHRKNNYLVLRPSLISFFSL